MNMTCYYIIWGWGCDFFTHENWFACYENSSITIFSVASKSCICIGGKISLLLTFGDSQDSVPTIKSGFLSLIKFRKLGFLASTLWQFMIRSLSGEQTVILLFCFTYRFDLFVRCLLRLPTTIGGSRRSRKASIHWICLTSNNLTRGVRHQ